MMAVSGRSVMDDGTQSARQQHLRRLSASASSFRPRSNDEPSSSSSSTAGTERDPVRRSTGLSSPSSSPLASAARKLRADSRPFNPRVASDQLPQVNGGNGGSTDGYTPPESMSSSFIAPSSPSLAPPAAELPAASSSQAGATGTTSSQGAVQPSDEPVTEPTPTPSIKTSPDTRTKGTATSTTTTGAKIRTVPYRNPERHTSGGPPPPSSKLSAEELAERMARIRLQNEEIMKRAAEVEDDKQSFQESAKKEREAREAELRAKRERERAVQRKVEEERRKVRERKESRKGTREWDAMKNAKAGSQQAPTPTTTLDWAEDS